MRLTTAVGGTVFRCFGPILLQIATLRSIQTMSDMIFVNSLTQARVRKNENLPEKLRESRYALS